MTLRSMGISGRVTWDNLPGRPTAFPPSPHTHAWGDVTGKPSTYPPASHTHPWGEITGTPASYPPSAHTHGWTDITGKPATYPPATHTHVWADITDRPTIPSATPLGSATPRALGTANAGSSTNAAREDHVHPLPSGRLELLTTATIGETGLLMLNLATKRYSVNAPSAVATDRVVVALNGIPQNGILQDAFVPAAGGSVSVGLLLPALGLAATVSVPIAVYRIT